MGAAQSGTGPLIVLTYDDWALGWSIRDALGAAGYCVHVYPRSILPFHTIKRVRPALVVIEQTPASGMVGFPLLDPLRRDPETAATPVVLYTSRPDDPPVASARLRVVAKAEPISAILTAVRDLLAPEG